MPNPGSAGSELGERPVSFSELRTLAGSEFGERTEPNPGSAGSEKGQGRTLVRHVRSSEKGPGRTLVWSSEKDRFLSLNSKEKKKNEKKNEK